MRGPSSAGRKSRYKRSAHFPGAYMLLSTSPPVLYITDWATHRPTGRLRRLQRLLKHDAAARWVRAHSVPYLLRALRPRRAFFLVRLSWTHEQRPGAVAWMKHQVEVHRKKAPDHQFIYLCNTNAEKRVFDEHGLRAVFCSQNAFADEGIFRPLPGADRRFDAVYDARISQFKRHYLAAEVQRLALISKMAGDKDIDAYIAETRRLLNHAHWFNNPFSTDYQVLSHQEVNRCLNQCRVGLCLSDQEGAMFASIQYLLAGLPVVSTHSLGGRDVFFDEETALLVDATPGAVAAGVEEMASRSVPPEVVRERTLEIVNRHRGIFFDLMQQIYAESGVERVFEQEWPGLFRHYLLDSETKHREILRRIMSSPV